MSPWRLAILVMLVLNVLAWGWWLQAGAHGQGILHLCIPKADPEVATCTWP